MREADFFELIFSNQIMEKSKIQCKLCPHNCLIASGKKGACGVRENMEGTLIAKSYGKVTSLSLDPIEKKPIKHFYPGTKILSIGSYGCNFRCGFCQNHEISMGTPNCWNVTPEEIAAFSNMLIEKGNIGVAYTYNEPFISFEFLLDCAMLIKKQGQKNIIVTNGYISEKPLLKILPFIDAINIDLKSFEALFYKNIGGDIEVIKRTIEQAAKHCHVEVTTLIINEENDSPEEMELLAKWLSRISKEIPLHISRFFPAYQYESHLPTAVSTIYQLVEIAKKYLQNVHKGNC